MIAQELNPTGCFSMWSHLKSILELGVAQIKIHAWNVRRISKNI